MPISILNQLSQKPALARENQPLSCISHASIFHTRKHNRHPIFSIHAAATTQPLSSLKSFEGKKPCNHKKKPNEESLRIFLFAFPHSLAFCTTFQPEHMKMSEKANPEYALNQFF